MTDINVFDARNELAKKMKRIQSLAADSMSEDICIDLLEELHTSCQADSCNDPNSESFQLSVDQVCDAVDTRTKIKVETLGEFYDFQRWTVDVGNTQEKTPLDKLRAVRCCKDDEPDGDEDIWYKSPLSSSDYDCPYALQDKWTGDRDTRNVEGITYYTTLSEDIGYDPRVSDRLLFVCLIPTRTLLTSVFFCSIV